MIKNIFPTIYIKKIMDASYEFKLIVGRKLNYFSNRIVDIYDRNGFTNIPFDREERQSMIRACTNDITVFFERVFVEKEMAAHLADKFYESAGNVPEFFTKLDDINMDAILTRNW